MGRINKTNKTTPVSTDELLIYDSEDTSDDKNITLGQIATFTESQNSTVSGSKIFANGVQFEKGNIAFGQYTPLPTGIGSYIAQYTHPTYGVRLLGYNGLAYQDLNIGSMPTAGAFSIKSLTNGDCNFGYNVNIAEDLGVTGDITANKFYGDGSELTNLPISGLANVSLSNLNTTATDYLKTVCGAIPKTATGVGQVVTFINTSNTTVAAPAGGSWLVLLAYHSNDSNAVLYSFGADVLHHAGEIIAGGTTIINARSGCSSQAALWRIA